MNTRRYSLDPLLRAMGMTLSQAAPLLALNGPYYRKYADEGMSRDVAEGRALKAGFHPYEIVEWEMADHDLEEEKADRRRRATAAQARYRERHESAREYDRARRRAYYEACGDYERARERRHYRENAEAIAAQKKLYREANAEQIKTQRRAYYLANAERLRAAARERKARKRDERAQGGEAGAA